ncbi:MAG: FkbM family methyltransferase [Acidobacteria bacterium]|nr:FkbM family methyltransferase [Acidobacteriota bacterium]
MLLDSALVRIGRVIGKPRGWERVVHTLAPPVRFAGAASRPVTTEDGYQFPVDPGTLLGWNVHFFGSYEPEVRTAIRQWLRPGDTALDVGANVGWHTLLMGTLVGPAGRVCAFEPNDSTRGRLIGAIEANGLSNVTVDRRAVSDRPGEGAFDAPAAGDLWDGTGRLVRDGARGRPIDCVTLDDYAAARRLDRVDFIKIDVEGWELAVLRGGPRTLALHAPTIVFEYDPAYVARCGGSADELTTCLTNAGYRLFALDPRRPAGQVTRLGDRGGNFLAVRRTAHGA